MLGHGGTNQARGATGIGNFSEGAVAIVPEQAVGDVVGTPGAGEE
jgi:hypothetical protein